MKSTTRKPKQSNNREVQSDPAVSYDAFKEYEGQKYTGMKIGRSHKWYYDEGEWRDKKITPDLWEISYAVTKRRAGKAPEGSGAPVGTEYHWYILAHQKVCKLNADDYTTSMTGLKFKVAHKRGGSTKWSATEKTRRKRMIKFLREVLEDLERQQVEEARTPKTAGPAKSVKKRAAKSTAGKKPDSAARPQSMTKPKRPRRSTGSAAR